MTRTLTIGAKVSDTAIRFASIRLGQCFILLDPPESLRRLENRVLIKLTHNRIQELQDGNVRVTVDETGLCALVYIHAELV